MARIVTITNTLLFLFLVWGCASLNKREVQAPKAPEPMPARTSPPVETANDRTIIPTTAANPSKEEIRMLQARLKAASFYVGPVDGIVGPKTRSGLLRLQAACANLKDLLESSAVDAQTARPDNGSSSSTRFFPDGAGKKRFALLANSRF
jgi:hypothetical protein